MVKVGRFLFERGQDVTPAQLGADHAKEIALDGREALGAPERHPADRAGRGAHAAGLAERFVDEGVRGAHIRHGPRDQIRAVVEVQAHALRAAHRGERIHVRVQVGDADEIAALAMRGEDAVELKQALPDGIVRAQTQRQHARPAGIPDERFDPGRVRRVIRGVQRAAEEGGILVGAERRLIERN